MKRVQHGSIVTVSYIGTLDNGRIFDSTDDSGPLTFTIGNDQVFPALEQAIIGMTSGETKNILIPAVDAYGARLDENIIKVKREMFPADRELRIGEKLRIEFNGGRERILIILDQNEHEVTLDGNHPLAGLDLTFALRLDAVL